MRKETPSVEPIRPYKKPTKRHETTLDEVSTSIMHLQTEQWKHKASQSLYSSASVHIADIPPKEYINWAGTARLRGCDSSFTHEGHMFCHFQNGRQGLEFAIRIQTQPGQPYTVSAGEETREEFNARIQILKSSISPDQEPWMQRSENGFEFRQ